MRYPVAALGVTQILGYGALFYAFPVAVPAIAADLGVSREWLFAAFSLGLLGGGLVAPHTGRLMDRIGAARLMTWGSVAAATVLAALALAPANPWAVGALIVGLELVAVCVTYDAAFATLATLRGAAARRSITHLTLIAGLASTLFWPLTGFLVEWVGWRATYGVYAGLHLLLALPLHAALARSLPEAVAPPRPGAPAVPSFPPVSAARRKAAFALLATSFTLTGMLIAAVSVHMVPILQAMALGTAAYAVSMVMGPMQVAVRLVDALFWKGVHPVSVALVSGGLVMLAVPVLLAVPGSLVGAVAFAALFGAGQGLSSIVRGSVPLVLFGPAGYGALLGRLTSIRQIAAAMSPLGFALMIAWLSPAAALWIAAALGLAGLVPLWLLHLEVTRAARGVSA
jgi:MFS family permease